jgi:hypothetical protein
MSEIPTYISPVLLKYCPKDGVTITAGPNRKRTIDAGNKHPELAEMTKRICRVGDSLSVMVNVGRAQGLIKEPGITEPAFNETHGSASSIFTSRFNRN